MSWGNFLCLAKPKIALNPHVLLRCCGGPGIGPVLIAEDIPGRLRLCFRATRLDDTLWGAKFALKAKHAVFLLQLDQKA